MHKIKLREMRQSEHKYLNDMLKKDYNLSYYALKLPIIVSFALIPLSVLIGFIFMPLLSQLFEYLFNLTFLQHYQYWTIYGFIILGLALPIFIFISSLLDYKRMKFEIGTNKVEEKFYTINKMFSFTMLSYPKTTFYVFDIDHDQCMLYHSDHDLIGKKNIPILNFLKVASSIHKKITVSFIFEGNTLESERHYNIAKETNFPLETPFSFEIIDRPYLEIKQLFERIAV